MIHRSCLAVVAVAVSCALLTPATHAAVLEGETSRSMCFGLAAQHSGISEELLRAMAKVESNFKADAVHFNRNGTHDVGVMQINSSHFPELMQRYHITEQMLLERPCINIAVGAAILGSFLNKFGPTWRAVGSYDAGTSSKREEARRAYAALVARSLATSSRGQRVASGASVHRRMVVVE